MANKMETIDCLKRKMLEMAVGKYCLKCDKQTRIERIFEVLSQVEDYSIQRENGNFNVVKIPASPNQTFVDKAVICEFLSKELYGSDK